MKKFLLATLCILIGVLAFAQAPQKISYQAVIRNNTGNLVTNQQVWLRISIMKNGGTGGLIDQPSTRSIVAIYTETHTVTTNANGLATIEIGGGVTSDNFAAIDWSNGTYYLKTSVDLTGRGRYEVMGMSQLISVPYAMYAQKAGSAVYETDPQFNAWDKDYNDLTNRPEIPVVPTNVSAFENDAQYITSADVPAQVNADWNATSGAGQILNKPELFSGNYNDLTNRPEIPTVPTNVSAFTNDANYITSADVPAQVNADWNATSGAGQILNKPEIPTVPTNVSAFTNDANYITSADVPAQVNADWNATSGAGQILNKPELFSGNYNDLTNKPAIPIVPTNVSAFTNDANYITSADVPAQVNADWNATSGAGQILNKPELFDGNYNNLTNTPDLSGYITAESQTLADAAALGNAINAQIKNLTDPTENQDAVTKKYVDELIAQLQAAIDALSGSGSGSGSNPNGNIPAHYTITFDANGGTGTMEPQTFTPGTVYTVPLNSFRKDEPFKCWNTSADGTGATYYTSQNMVLWSNITLYAQWGYDRFFDSRDSTYYRYITIGDQTWMADNLRYVGNIPYGGSTKASTESYWYYNNLYNWTAATSGICPTGWHLPSADEWNQLFSFLRSHSEYQCGSSNSIGKSLASTTGWNSSSTDCTPGNTPSDNNSSGFNARPMGYWGSATGNGAYVDQGNVACFWSSTVDTGIQQAKYFAFGYNGFDVSLYSQGKYYAYNVRCVKD